MSSENRLRDRITESPLLPAKVDAAQLIRSSLLPMVDEGPIRASLDDIIHGDPKAASLIAGVLHHSPFLTRLVKRHPEWLIASLDSEPGARMQSLLAGVLPACREASEMSDAMRQLRGIRQEIALHIALADLGGAWTVDEVVRGLTAFADAAVDVALRLALQAAVARGHLTMDDPFGRPEASGITILAMGKHGAGELNYSSDIDLIALFDPDRLPITDHREPLEVAVRIIQDVVKVLHEQTGGGYVFRTDLRLRPDPASTPIAVPFERALHYYQTVGQNWERAALIKARPVAGDHGLGAAFLKELTPFIWRRYFDYAAIADIHAMKRQIHAHKGGAEIAIEGHDIKLGRGGIREIEFFVQTQQLVFGGRKPSLRGHRTLDMLDGLNTEGWISGEAVSDLQSAYRALRRIEHRLQMVDDEQTQRLPRGKADVDRFALFCGSLPQTFRRGLTEHLKAVERHYAHLFENAPALTSGIGNLVFTGTTDDPDTIQTLKRLGFHRPELVVETVRGWHFGRRRAIITERAREVLTELTPSLLQALGRSSNPDGALLTLDTALQSMPAVVELFTILKQNASLLTLFAEVLGNAPVLADVVVQRPHVLDILVDPTVGRVVSDQEMRERFRSRLEHVTAFEDFLDQLRDLVRAERFAIGAHLLSGVIDCAEMGHAHAGIASACIDVALARVIAELRERHGIIPGARLAVMGLGKLGGREMTYRSDLDLIVIYDLATPDCESDGERSLSPSEWFSRLIQRLVTSLTAPTKRGLLYDVDLRLRPSGNKGPLAVSLQALQQYHAGESETWERMALTRARFIAGDPGFGREVSEAIRTACNRVVDPDDLRRDIRTMRSLVAQEKPASGHLDLKLTPGGFVDIEFAAQYLMLAHGREQPTFPHPNTGRALRAIADASLMPAKDADCLHRAWQLQSSLAQVLALDKDRTHAPSDVGQEAFGALLARSVGLPNFKVLDAELKSLQREAAQIVHRVLG